MKNALLVFLGGGMGSVLRYIATRYLNNSTLPLGTFTVNVLGSLLLGMILGLALKYPAPNSTLTVLFGVGFCGGFTTFSTFAVENQAFLRSGDLYNFFLYTFGSLLAGILAVFAGVALARLFY